MEATAINLALERVMRKGARVTGLTRLTGGASQETWAFELDGSPFILRRVPHEGPRNSEALSLAVEAELIRLARDARVLVPTIAHVCRPADGLGEGFIMDFVAGETLARKILRDEAYVAARRALAGQCGKALTAIHAIPHHKLPDALKSSNGLDQLGRYEGIYRSFNVNRPVLDLAISWLRATAPTPVQASLVHGDFRLGNLIVGAEGLRAVLDWELAHIGDPREDLGWICVNSWRFGQSKKAVGGFGELCELVESYQANGGAAFALADIKWFQALGSLKWGIMCLIMYEAFRSGADTSIERAMIGRRTSEAEFDLLNLMEGTPYA